MNESIRPKKSVMFGYMAPIYIIYLIFFIAPVCLAIYFSFFNFRNVNSKVFIGLSNYAKLFRDAKVVLALKNNLVLMALNTVGQIGIAFVLANFLNSRAIKKGVANLFRTVIYFPHVLSAIIIGYVWTMVYDYKFGIVNYFLRALGYEDWAQVWLSKGSSIMTVISIPMIWQHIGFHLIILMSAMTAINSEIYEMAELDGASAFRKAISITFPLIRNTVFICVILCISANLKAFDSIVAMTNGGPGFSSMVIALYAYNQSFTHMNIGYGNTISVAMMVIMVVVFGGSRAITYYINKKHVY